MAVLKGLLEAGKLTPVVDRTYLLSEVSEAIRYLEEGHAQGKGVIPCEGNTKEDSSSHSVGEDVTGDHRSGSRGCVPGDALPTRYAMATCSRRG
jgi:Zinc-binding dehydrogenase